MMQRYLSSLFILALVVGCTRAKEEATVSSIHLKMPQKVKNQKTSALNTELSISHIVVNITGSGIDEQIFWDWDACSQGCANASPPPDIRLEVPAGSDRLIQVLGIYEDTSSSSGSSGMDFRYGDTVQTLTNDVESVEITLESFTNTQSKPINFAGRYVDAGGNTPTGKVEVRFQPPNNKPVMKMMESEIFAGWFKFFAVSGVNLDYVLVPSEKVLFEDLNPSSDQLKASDRVVVVSLPEYYRVKKDYDTTTSQFVVQPNDHGSNGGEDLALGFFGAAASTQVACYTNSSNQQIFVQNYDHNQDSQVDSIEGLYTDSQGTQALIWNGSNTSNSLAVSATGGVIDSDPRCSSNDHFVSNLVFNYLNLQNGDSAAMGFAGPFQYRTPTGTTDYGNFIDVGFDSTAETLTLDWTYLPDVLSGTEAIDGVAIFSKFPIADGDEDLARGEGGFACERLASLGYQEVGRTSGQTYTLTGISSANVSQTSVIVCPYSSHMLGLLGTEYFESGQSAHLQHLNGNNNNGNTSNGPPQLIALLHSNGNIEDPSENLVTHSFLSSIIDSFFAFFTGGSMAVDVVDVGSTLQPANLNIPPYIYSVSRHPDQSTFYGLLPGGEVVQLDNSGNPIDIASNCPFSTCQVPPWMQSMSVGRAGKIYSLDFGGNLYELDNSGNPIFIQTVPQTVVQVSYY